MQRDKYDGTPCKGCEKNPGEFLEGFDGDGFKRCDSNQQHPQNEDGDGKNDGSRNLDSQWVGRFQGFIEAKSNEYGNNVCGS